MKVFLLSLVFLALPASAALPQPPAPQVDARAWLLIDTASGLPLAEKNADAAIEPASLTKLMTAYLAFSAIKEGRLTLGQTLPVSQRAWKAEGSRMFLDPRKPAQVDDLLRGMIVQSGNDACVVLAEAIAGSEEGFVVMMNETAKNLGMTNTHFMDSTGLPQPKHLTTARDLARLTGALIRTFPEFYKIYSTKSFRYNGITQPNRNRLLFIDPTVDGVKTGHTESAGYCLIASARRDQRRLISVVLGANSDNARAMESLKLLNYGFQFFETVRLYPGACTRGARARSAPVFSPTSTSPCPVAAAETSRRRSCPGSPCWPRCAAASASPRCACPAMEWRWPITPWSLWTASPSPA